MDKKSKINIITIGFLIFSIMCFGALSFIFERASIVNILNYYIIAVCGIAIIILFFNNLECYKIKNIKKVPLILSIISILWFIITALFGITLGITTIKGFINFTELFVLLNIIINIKFTEKERNILITITLVSFLLTVILGIFQYFSGINLVTHTNSLYPGILGRISSTFHIATLYDKFVVIITPLIFYNILKDKNKYLNNILVLLSGIGICLTFSRSGIIIYLSILFIYFIIFIFRKKILSLITIVLTVICMLLIPGTTYMLQSAVNFIYDIIKTPSEYQIDLLELNPILDKYVYSIFDSKEEKKEHEKVEVVKKEEDKKIKKALKTENNKSADNRAKYKAVGVALIKEYPVFGIGIGNYSYLYNNQNFADYLKDDSVIKVKFVMYPHNGYVQLAAEIGYLGAILFIATIISFLFNIIKDKNYKWEILTAIMMLYGLAISGYTESIFHNKQYIYITMLIYVLNCTLIKNEKPLLVEENKGTKRKNEKKK